MSRLKATTLLGWVDSDGEEDILSSGHKPVQRMAPPKKATKFTTQTATRQPDAAKTRKALTDKPTNVQEKTMAGRGRKRPAPEEVPAPAPDQDRQDENAIEANSKPKGARGRPRAAKAAKVAEMEDEIPETQPEPAVQPPAKRGRKPKARSEVEREIPETQLPEPEIPETQQVETTELSLDEDGQMEELPNFSRIGMSSVQRAQPQMLFGASHRTVPASDSKLNDPSMRRRVGDLTRKYQDLEAKYRDLREIGVMEAERNYDRLKQQSEEKSNSKSRLHHHCICILRAYQVSRANFISSC